MPPAPVGFSGARYEANETTPAIGEHTDEILRGLGYDDEMIERLINDGIVRRAD